LRDLADDGDECAEHDLELEGLRRPWARCVNCEE
jgi:hypothetical protein